MGSEPEPSPANGLEFLPAPPCPPSRSPAPPPGHLACWRKLDRLALPAPWSHQHHQGLFLCLRHFLSGPSPSISGTNRALGSPSCCTGISRCWSPPCCSCQSPYPLSSAPVPPGLSRLGGVTAGGGSGLGEGVAWNFPPRDPRGPRTSGRSAHPRGHLLGTVEGAAGRQQLSPGPQLWAPGDARGYEKAQTRSPNGSENKPQGGTLDPSCSLDGPQVPRRPPRSLEAGPPLRDWVWLSCHGKSAPTGTDPRCPSGSLLLSSGPGAGHQLDLLTEALVVTEAQGGNLPPHPPWPTSHVHSKPGVQNLPHGSEDKREPRITLCIKHQDALASPFLQIISEGPALPLHLPITDGAMPVAPAG